MGDLNTIEYSVTTRRIAALTMKTKIYLVLLVNIRSSQEQLADDVDEAFLTRENKGRVLTIL